MELSRCDRFHCTLIAPFGELVKPCSNGIRLHLVPGGSDGMIRSARARADRAHFVLCAAVSFQARLFALS